MRIRGRRMMGKIIIKGNFTVESDYNFLHNVKQPLRLLEIEIPQTQPFRVNRFTCAETNKGCGKVIAEYEGACVVCGSGTLCDSCVVLKDNINQTDNGGEDNEETKS